MCTMFTDGLIHIAQGSGRPRLGCEQRPSSVVAQMRMMLMETSVSRSSDLPRGRDGIIESVCQRLLRLCPHDWRA